MIPPPEADADVPQFVASLGLPGLVDVHTHFLPDRVMDKVWGYFDAAEAHYGMAWPIHYASNPYLKGTPAEYKAALGSSPVQVIDAVPGTVKTF